jgi:hypothetical protein
MAHFPSQIQTHHQHQHLSTSHVLLIQKTTTVVIKPAQMDIQYCNSPYEIPESFFTFFLEGPLRGVLGG